MQRTRTYSTWRERRDPPAQLLWRFPVWGRHQGIRVYCNQTSH
jgi:hypothetical protein